LWRMGRSVALMSSPESIDAVSSASNIAACVDTTITAYKPAFAFVFVDKAIDDGV
jgi:hypothetical protein